MAAAVVVAVLGVVPAVASAQPPTRALTGVRLENVAARVGLDYRQGAFRFGVSPDTAAMTGGGLCWLDYNGDGWQDLFAVNSYSDQDTNRWESRGGLPRSALYRNPTRSRRRAGPRCWWAGGLPVVLATFRRSRSALD